MSIIMSEVNSRCSGLWESAQKAVKCPSVAAGFLTSPVRSVKPLPSVGGGGVIDSQSAFTISQLTLSHIRIGGSGADRRHSLVNIPEVCRVTAATASDNWRTFICSVTGALILSNVELCGEMNGGIVLD